MNQKEIGKYKDDIVDIIIQNSDIVSLLNPNPNTDFIPEDLIDQNIYTYCKIPQTNEKTKTYITITINIPSISNKNDIMKNLRIIINVISCDSLMKVKGTRTNRVDLIVSHLDILLNESQKFGVGKLELVSSVEGILEGGFPYRCLILQSEDLNNQRYGK